MTTSPSRPERVLREALADWIMLRDLLPPTPAEMEGISADEYAAQLPNHLLPSRDYKQLCRRIHADAHVELLSGLLDQLYPADAILTEDEAANLRERAKTSRRLVNAGEESGLSLMREDLT